MFNKEALLSFIKYIERYDLVDQIPFIFDSIRLTASLKNEFSLADYNQVAALNINIPKELNITTLNLFNELQVLNLKHKYSLDTVKIELLLNFINIYFDTELSKQNQTLNNLLWNLNFQFKNQLSYELRTGFSDLTSHLKNIISIAQKRIIFCAPYFSITGLEILLPSLKAALNKNPNLKIVFIIESEANKTNRDFVKEIGKLLPKSSYEIYVPFEQIDEGLVLHSKFLVVDNNKGYLGSANFSERALRQQFELGMKLAVSESKSLSILVESWIQLKYLKTLR